VVRVHLGVQPGEQVLLVADPVTDMAMAWALAGAVQEAGGEFTLAVMPARHNDRATELTAILDAGLERTDVIIGLTGASGAPTYSRKVAELLGQKRLRALSMVMRSMDNWTRGAALADYAGLGRLGRRVGDAWAAGSPVARTSAAGTHVTAGEGKAPA